MFEEDSSDFFLHKSDSSNTLYEDSSEQKWNDSDRDFKASTKRQPMFRRTSRNVRLQDKISFAIGVSNTCITPLVVVRAPEWMPIYYTLQFLYFITFRVFEYKAKRWHYFFFDLCYFVNVLMLLFLWVFPSSTTLFSMVFTLTNGPVLWAVVTWRNSLVFHSLDKITSVFIHIYPALVTYVLRWFAYLHVNHGVAKAYQAVRFPGVFHLRTMGWWYTLFISAVPYFIWQALYIQCVMINGKEKIRSGERVVSYSLLLKPSTKKKPFILSLVSMFGEKYVLHMFVFWQFWYTLGTCALTYFYYKSFWLHSASLIIMFAVCVWNGSTYYIDVFSKSYQNEVQALIDKDE